MQHNPLLLIYDDNCPLCTWYSAQFVRRRLLDAKRSVPFSTLSPELMKKIDIARARNEIPLINTSTNQVQYGIDALLTLLACRLPLVATIGHWKPVHWFLRKLYKFISYNRQLIVAQRCSSGFDCAPDLNVRYRLLFMLVFLAFTTWMLVPVHTFLIKQLPGFTLSATSVLLAHFAVLAINLILFIKLGWKRGLEFLAQANMLALIAVLLTLPLLLAGQFTLLPLWITVPYLSLLAVIIFREYVRRMHYAGILPGMNWIAGINLASMTSFVLYLFT